MLFPDPTASPVPTAEAVPNPDPSSLLVGAAGLGIIGLVIGLVFAIGGAALALWTLYTVIWRAVRRGLREYHAPTARAAGLPPAERISGPRDWSPSGW